MVTEAIMNRGIGKPRDHSTETGGRIDLSALTAEERQAMIGLLKKAMGVQQGAKERTRALRCPGGCAARATGSYLSRPAAVQLPHVSTVPLALLWAFRPEKGSP